MLTLKRPASDGKEKNSPILKFGKASQIPKNEAYFSYAAGIRDAAQPKAKIEVGLFTKPSLYFFVKTIPPSTSLIK